ncbi:hypothetical protein MKW98_018167 [Papaver atlanticum]|uniref:SANTA domain-containing protein n=1 Tax=Papaver atlanticum TaxID=357466 RepID=A0AAD4SB47_9MAGN|nr:hypothetical protein MKW98_018167 [Papaver atlanticum]
MATPRSESNFISSKDEQTVYLEDWWLIKSDKEIDGKRLAVEGFALRDPRSMGVFSTAPIIKRYNICTLRTADGITIVTRGSINASRTLENGFSSEICSLFLLGFPWSWETYSNPCVEDESANRGVTTSMDAFLESTTMLSSLPNFLRGRADTKTRDHIFCFPGVTENSASTENLSASLLEKCIGNDLRNPTMPVSADTTCCNPVLGDSLPEKTPIYEERSATEIKHGREEDLLCGKDGETVEKENIILEEDETSKLKSDRCIHPKNKVLAERSFEENLETSTGGLRVLTNGAVKSSDVDMLATEETTVNKENCEVHGEGTMVNEYNLFPNQDNHNTDSCNEPVLPLNEVIKPFNIELSEARETLIGKEEGTVKTAGSPSSDKQDSLGNSCIEDGKNATVFSTSRRITRNALKNIVNYGKSSSEHCAVNNGFEEKNASTSPNEGRPTKKMRLRKCTDSVTRNEASKDILVPIANDLNNDNPKEVSMVSKGSSKGFGGSKSGSKGRKKTRANLKISGAANNVDGCWNESLKADSISVGSDAKTVDSCELIVDVPFLPLNEKGVKSLDTELHETKETSIDKEGGAEENKQDNPNDTGNESERDSVKENSIKEKSGTPDDEVPGVQLNEEVTELSVLESFSTEETLTSKEDGENVNILHPSRRITRNTLKNAVNYGKALNGHHASKKSIEEKRVSISPNEVCPNKDFRSSRRTNNTMKNDLPKDILIPIAKDIDIADSLGVNVALTVDLKRSSKRFGSSKNSSKGEKKTRVNMKSSRPASSSCGFDSGKADSVKEASASTCSDMKSLSPSEVNAALQESLSKAPIAGSHGILDIAGDCIDHTMEDSPRQVNIETNASCLPKMDIDAQSAAARTRSRFKNIEGKVHKNTMCREHLSGGGFTSPSICKIDAMEEITDSSKGRITNNRVKISRNKSKVAKPTNRGRSGLDQPNDRFQETVPGKRMWKEASPLRTAGINRKMQYSNTPEQSSLSLKRSRSGRLLIPPLEFWRNELVMYDKDREITGIQEGTPNVVDHPIGSRSEPPKTKRKLVYS